MISTAYWKPERKDQRHYYYFCSHCNTKSNYRKPIYCPGCGLRMIEGRKDKK